MWSNGVKTAFSKNYEKLSSGWMLRPRPPIASRGWSSAPRPPQWCVWITIHFFTQHVSQFRRFLILTIGLKGVKHPAGIMGIGQKLKKHLKHFFAKFQLSTSNGSWDISFQSWEISRSPRQCCQLKSKFLGIGIY